MFIFLYIFELYLEQDQWKEQVRHHCMQQHWPNMLYMEQNLRCMVLMCIKWLDVFPHLKRIMLIGRWQLINHVIEDRVLMALAPKKHIKNIYITLKYTNSIWNTHIGLPKPWTLTYIEEPIGPHVTWAMAINCNRLIEELWHGQSMDFLWLLHPSLVSSSSFVFYFIFIF